MKKRAIKDGSKGLLFYAKMTSDIGRYNSKREKREGIHRERSRYNFASFEYDLLRKKLHKIKAGLYQLIIPNFAKSAWILEIFGPRYIRMSCWIHFNHWKCVSPYIFHYMWLSLTFWPQKASFLRISRNWLDLPTIFFTITSRGDSELSNGVRHAYGDFFLQKAGHLETAC